MLRSRHGILDRLAAAFGDAGNDQPRGAGVDVYREIDRSEYGLRHLLQSGGEDLEDCCAGYGVLAAKDAQERTALRLICPFVDDDGGFALAFVDRARPTED